jgi:hypothetical protein
MDSWQLRFAANLQILLKNKKSQEAISFLLAFQLVLLFFAFIIEKQSLP